MLVRSIRRRTLFESRDISEIVDAEFLKDGQPDLSVSVYEIPDEQQVIVRVHAEHYAGAGLKPRAGSHIDLSSVHEGDTTATEGNCRFMFCKRAHREIRFVDEAELRHMVSRLLDQIDSRTRRVVKDELWTYVSERLSSKDPEWEVFFSEPGSGTEWRDFATKRRTGSGQTP